MKEVSQQIAKILLEKVSNLSMQVPHAVPQAVPAASRIDGQAEVRETTLTVHPTDSNGVSTGVEHSSRRLCKEWQGTTSQHMNSMMILTGRDQTMYGELFGDRATEA